MSYTIDVYRRKLSPTDDFISFAAFVSFFPQLVAGPIERATNLLPQFGLQRNFNYLNAIDGLRQILWGLFKKVVIADNCAIYANQIFNNSAELNGSTLVLGAFYFAFQIYGDFSGYSDIAIGTARLFGINLRKNFAFPYFSRDIAEFWRRWHISLSTWFRDYVYIPLGGSRGNNLLKIRNVFIIFLVSGFWHGANWTFIFWGALNAAYFLPLMLTKANRNNIDIVSPDRVLPTIADFSRIAITFLLTTFAWIFFRADDMSHALSYISTIFSTRIFEIPDFESMSHGLTTVGLVFIFVLIEWKGRFGKYGLELIGLKWQRLLRLLFYHALVISVLYYGGQEQQFIYFQF